MDTSIQIIECPRDAIQGLHIPVSTEDKISYYNALLKVGFPYLDCGSFVSPKAIPQMADTAQVLDALEPSEGTKLGVIVANIRGAERGLAHPRVDSIGFPFSISETFQQHNTNKSRAEAFAQLQTIQEMANQAHKDLVIYLSMAFGNPYGEEWLLSELLDWAAKFVDMGVPIINLSDTVGVATNEQILSVFSEVHKLHPYTTWGAHLHTEYDDWFDKVELAYRGGCRRFDGAIKGFGGCPMAETELVGNMPTEKLISFAAQKKLNHNLNTLAFESAYNSALRYLA